MAMLGDLALLSGRNRERERERKAYRSEGERRSGRRKAERLHSVSDGQA